MAKKKTEQSAPKNDERNLVGAEQVDIQDLEDQAFLFWEKNRSTIIGGVVVLFAIFLGFQGMKFLSQRAEAERVSSYQAISSSEERAAWAEEHSGTPLAGVAYKTLADEAYAFGDLDKAAALYRKSIDDAAEPVKSAATISLAMTLVRLDKSSEAKPLLQKIADDAQALAQAEAQYRLALIASEEGDAATARSYIESIPETARFWNDRAQALAEQLPKG